MREVVGSAAERRPAPSQPIDGHEGEIWLRGPSARVVMGGRVDLARETQRLRVRVTPHLSDSVSLAGALIGGPVAGVATFLAQKILKDPIEELVSFEYDVTGGWSDPQVTKVARAPLTPVEDSP